jgi:sugar diacid utilization regulator
MTQPAHLLHREMVDAVLGEGGLDRVATLAAAAARGPVAIVAPLLGGPWLAPNEHGSHTTLDAVERAALDRIAGRIATAAGGVALEVPIVREQATIGAVALLGEEPPAGESALELLQLAALATLTAVAIAEAGNNAERGLRGSLLEELRTNEQLDAEEIVRRGAWLGCHLDRGGVAMCAETSDVSPGHLLAMVASESHGALAEQVSLPSQEKQRTFILIPATGSDLPECTAAAARRLAIRLGRNGTVGVSTYSADATGLRHAVQEAELMLDILLRSGDSISCAVATSGTYRLLFRVLSSHPEELAHLYENTVAPLVVHDDRYRTDLLGTLETYLAENCNMNATAAKIFAHRHTVAYRLDRVRELTGLDPSRSEDRERLGLGLKAYRLIVRERG